MAIKKRLMLSLKIVLAIGCMYTAFHIYSVNHAIDIAIHDAEIASRVTPKKRTAVDSAENRMALQRQRLAMVEQTKIMRAKKYPWWGGYISLTLSYLAGALIRNVVVTLYKSRSKQDASHKMISINGV